jgi:hypothetical protein
MPKFEMFGKLNPILGNPWNISLSWRINNYEKYMQILGGAILSVSSN